MARLTSSLYRVRNPRIDEERGFTMIEVLVALGLIAIMGLAAGSYVYSSVRGQARAEASGDFNRKIADLINSLSSTRSCQASMSQVVTPGNWGALTSPSGLNFNSLHFPGSNGDTVDIATVGQLYGRIRIAALNLRLEGAVSNSQINGISHTSYKALLEVRTENIDEATGGARDLRIRTLPLFLSVADSNRAVAGCFEDADNSGILQATCESLGGRFVPPTSSSPPGCTALDPINAAVASEVQTRLDQINQSRANLAANVSQLNSQLSASTQVVEQQIQRQAQEVNFLTQRLSQLNQNLSSTDRNIASTNQNLQQTNRDLAAVQGQLTSATNNLQRQIDEMFALLRSYRSQAASQQQTLSSLQTDMGATNNRLSQLNQTNSAFSSALLNQQGSIQQLSQQAAMTQDGLQNVDNSLNMVNWQIQNITVRIWSLSAQIQTISSCPFGRNQWGNCIEPRPPETCDGGNCTF